jgi:hypothetical protein
MPELCVSIPMPRMWLVELTFIEMEECCDIAKSLLPDFCCVEHSICCVTGIFRRLRPSEACVVMFEIHRSVSSHVLGSRIWGSVTRCD